MLLPAAGPAAPVKQRTISLTTKLVVVTLLVVGLGSALLFRELDSRERSRLTESKVPAANMIADLLAESISPTLDFDDAEGTRSELDHFRSNTDVRAASVWPLAGDAPIASWQSAGEGAPARPPDAEVDRVTVRGARLDVTRTVRGKLGKPIGRVKLTLSLDREIEAHRGQRRQLFWISFVMAAGTAMALLAFARRAIVTPLATLARAAQEVERGNVNVRMDVRSRDEIGQLASAFETMRAAVVFRQQRFEKELEIAARIQTSILPRDLGGFGLDISAAMIPATEAGGDYYDVLPAPGGCWLGIGDVAGHGLNAGLIMMMIQSVVSALVHCNPAAEPRQVLVTLNRVIHDNVRKRLRQDEHATLSVLRYEKETGRLVHSGAHEIMIVCRARDGKCETIDTLGPWIGAARDISRVATQSELHLDPGDLLVLYTDGVTEARDAAGEQLGLERLCALVEKLHERPVDEVRDGIVHEARTWAETQEDDITLLVARRA